MSVIVTPYRRNLEPDELDSAAVELSGARLRLVEPLPFTRARASRSATLLACAARASRLFASGTLVSHGTVARGKRNSILGLFVTRSFPSISIWRHCSMCHLATTKFFCSFSGTIATWEQSRRCHIFFPYIRFVTHFRPSILPRALQALLLETFASCSRNCKSSVLGLV